MQIEIFVTCLARSPESVSWSICIGRPALAHAPPKCNWIIEPSHAFWYPFRSQTVANLQPYCMDRKSAK